MIPPVASSIATSAGVPSRPRCAVTTPSTATAAPITRARISVIGVVGGGVGDGDAVEVPEGAGVALGGVDGVMLGVGLGTGVGLADGEGVGVGLGPATSTASSPAAVG